MVLEISNLLDQENEIPQIKEAAPDLPNRFRDYSKQVTVYLNTIPQQSMSYVVPSLRDRAGEYVFKADNPMVETVARRGNTISDGANGTFAIVEVEPRYLDDDLAFYVCKVEEANA